MLTEMMREPLAKMIKYIKPIGYDDAEGLTAQVYDQLQADFLPAPLITLHSPIPPVMAGAWSILRETLMAGQVSRAHKEVVALTVSKANECPFCVDAHSVLLRATSHHEAANAILEGDYDEIHDPRLRALVQWTWTNRTSNPTLLAPPPFSQDEMPEILGTVVTFHYLNRMANIFLGDSLLPLPLPSALKEFSYRLYVATEGKRVVRSLPSGTSLKFLSQAKLPDDLSWAAGNASIAKAFAGFVKEVEEAGERVVPESVQRLVKERVRVWHGETMGISRHWVEEAVTAMGREHRATARLALLTALASYQVDTEIIDAFRSQSDAGRADTSLIATTAWASLTAARRVGEWLSEPFKTAV